MYAISIRHTCIHAHINIYIFSIIKSFNTVSKSDFTVDEFVLFLCSYGNL